MNKEIPEYPYLEFDPDLRIGYVHFSETEKSDGCLTWADLESAIRRQYNTNIQKMEKARKKIGQESVKYSMTNQSEHYIQHVSGENNSEENEKD